MQSPEMRRRFLLEAVLATAEAAATGGVLAMFVHIGLMLSGKTSIGQPHVSVGATYRAFIFGFAVAGLMVGLVTPAGAKKWTRRAIAFVALIPVMVWLPLVFDAESAERMPNGAIAVYALLECLFCSFPFGDQLVATAAARAGKRQRAAQHASSAVSERSPSSRRSGDDEQVGGGGTRP